MTEKFCLKWNDFERSISSAFKDIREENDFFDVTLACDGAESDPLQAHKVILSACSPFFRRVLKRNPHQHPLLYLKGVTFRDLQYVLEFMYHGEVNVAQDDLNAFLAVAEELQVKGLTQSNASSASNSNSSSSKSNTNQPSNHQSTAHARSSLPSSRTRPSDSSGESASKRFRASESTPSVPAPLPISNLQTQEEDDDIQEVVPVKTEHLAAPPHPDPGTMAMYNEQETYDETDQDYEMEGDTYTEENYLVQDGSTGLYVECPECYKAPATCTLCNRSMKNDWSLKEHERKYHGILQSQKDILQ